MTTIAVDSFLIVLLMLLNGVLAMAEIAVVSARKTRLQQRAEQGDAGARVALELATTPNCFLSTVQIGITLVGILAGAVGDATMAEYLSTYLRQVPGLASYSKAISFGIVVVAITYLSLIIGELVPKRLALNNPEGIATTLAKPMRLLSVIAYPAVRLLSISTDWVLRTSVTSPALTACTSWARRLAASSARVTVTSPAGPSADAPPSATVTTSAPSTTAAV